MVELLVVKDLIQFFQQLPQQEVEQVCLGVHLLQEPVCQEDPVAELLLELVLQEDLETLLQLVHLKEMMEEILVVLLKMSVVVVEVVP
jgi:hypothetical protein